MRGGRAMLARGSATRHTGGWASLAGAPQQLEQKPQPAAQRVMAELNQACSAASGSSEGFFAAAQATKQHHRPSEQSIAGSLAVTLMRFGNQRLVGTQDRPDSPKSAGSAETRIRLLCRLQRCAAALLGRLAC